jgi:hypothetical protein
MTNKLKRMTNKLIRMTDKLKRMTNKILIRMTNKKYMVTRGRK